MNNSKVNNEQLASLYVTRVQQTGGDVGRARVFAELISDCPRSLYAAYQRRQTLRGIREGPLDLTADGNQEAKRILEDILGGLAKVKEQVFNAFNKPRQPREDITIEDLTSFTGGAVSPELIGTGCRWNGEPYHPEWYKEY